MRTKSSFIPSIPMLLLSLLIAGFLSGNPSDDLPTVDELNLKRYAGSWYEIARLPNSFEKGLECITANYTLKSNGKFEVLNNGFSKKKGAFQSSKGKAWRPDDNYPGRLKVSFFWPFAGDYYIISLDKEYTYALVGDPSRKYLWVLSRTKQLDDSIYSKLIERADGLGFATDQMIRIQHNCQ